jgi:hypothetical protein
VTRPAGATVAALLLALVGLLSVGVGALASLVSNCCGSSDPADPTGVIVGLAVGVTLGVAAGALWTGGSRAAVLGPAAAPVVFCLGYGGWQAPDLLGLGLLMLPAYAVLVLLCRRPRWRSWLLGSTSAA